MELLPHIDYTKLSDTHISDPFNTNLVNTIRSLIGELLSPPIYEETTQERLRYVFHNVLKISDRILKVGLLNSTGIVIIKYIRSGEDTLENEYNVATELNKLREHCINFPYTYGSFNSTIPHYINENAYIWPSTHSTGVQHIIQSYVEHDISLFEYYTDMDWTLPEIISIILQITLALECAHKLLKFTHGDLNPSNILLKRIPKDSWIRIGNNYVKSAGILAFIIDFDYSSTKKHISKVKGHWMPPGELNTNNDLAILLEFMGPRYRGDDRFSGDRSKLIIFIIKYMVLIGVVDETMQLKRSTISPSEATKKLVNLINDTDIVSGFPILDTRPGEVIEQSNKPINIMINIPVSNNEFRYLNAKPGSKIRTLISKQPSDELDKTIKKYYRSILQFSARIRREKNHENYKSILINIMNILLLMGDMLNMLVILAPNSPATESVRLFLTTNTNSLRDKKWTQANMLLKDRDIFDIMRYLPKRHGLHY